MANMIGKGYIFGFGSFATSINISGTPAYTMSTYVMPKVDSLSLSQQADYIEDRNQEGDVDALIGNPIGVTCSFRVKPRGTTIANAKVAANFPQVIGSFSITGLPIIAFAGFVDVFNTNGTNAQKWIYDGNGSIDGVNDNVWTATLTLRRYFNISDGALIT